MRRGWATVALVAVLMTGCSAQDDWHTIASEPGQGYKIGTDQWPAGTWETGGAQPNSPECTWARRSDMTNSAESLLGLGSVLHHPQRVAINAGEYFVSSGCLPWHYMG